MQIQQLTYFMKIADLGGMNKVAETLLMTQPNLSRVIIDLEAELSIKLFRHNNKGMVTTEDGKKLYQYNRAILNQMDLTKGMVLREIVPVFSIVSYPLMSTLRLLCETYNNHKGESLKIQLLEHGL